MIVKIKFGYVYLFVIFMVAFTLTVSSLLIGGEIFYANLPYSNKTVVIDAGHGGLDGGASSKDGTTEKNINLKIALYLKKQLEEQGINVVMTRLEDISLHTSDDAAVRQKKREDLNKRREIANNSNADFLISIHLNYFQEAKYKGAQVFYESNHKESSTLATFLQNSLIKNVDSTNTRVAKKIDSKKLLFTDLKIPGVIAECGFLSNEEEAALLKTDDYQKKIADGLYLGIIDYFSNTTEK